MRNNNEDSTNGKSTIDNMYKYEADSSGASLEIISAKKIEKYWLTHRDRQIFRLLKHSICAAEHSLSKEILRKISPLESNLLNDRCLNVKIKFRFAGDEYPPYIVFKIYSQTHDGNTSKYINGKNMIKSTAAQEACNQMGNRIYMNQMIVDSLQAKSNNKIIDKENIVSIREFMQYTSLLDELPAYMGGRSNAWRRLNLSDLPRHTIFYDVLNYATTRKMSRNLSKEMSTLLMAPSTQSIQLEHIKILSKFEIPDDFNQSLIYLNSSASKNSFKVGSSRRSKNAVNKISKMKKAYMMTRSETLTTEADIATSVDQQNESFKLPEDLNDDFENEVKNLYMWTKNLSVNDVDSI